MVRYQVIITITIQIGRGMSNDLAVRSSDLTWFTKKVTKINRLNLQLFNLRLTDVEAGSSSAI